MNGAVRERLVAALERVPEKAEIVDGEIRMMNPTGGAHGRAVLRIAISLAAHEGKTPGHAFADNVGFLTDLPHRFSFSPDAAWYVGPPPGKKFLPVAPVFAAEVRSDDDAGPAGERAMAAKRADYFAAGTLVVWDVDLDGADTVRVFRASAPDAPSTHRRGETADAEPAVPGWRFGVDDLFT
ncbi:MAG: Uma2 family endonuclease [Gemmatimonadaceae bacterium]